MQPPRAKLLVFIHAAVLAGLSGWLLAHFQRAANPTPFGAQAGIEYLFIAVVGGAGYVWGGVLGAAIVVILKEILQSYLPYLFHGEGQLETIVFGIILVVLLQLAPNGVWPWLMARLPLQPGRKPRDLSLKLLPRVRPAGASEVLLEVANARKQFGGVIAVNDVSFKVQPREIVALIGPNGAGKSTTFNLITGVLAATGGSISVLGTKIDDAPPQEVAKLGISRTFQHVKLVPDMSVLENVAIGAHLRGTAGALASMLRLDRGEERNCWRKRRVRSNASVLPSISINPPAAFRWDSSVSWKSPARCASIRSCYCWTNRRRDCGIWKSSGSPSCCVSCVRAACRCCWWNTTWDSSWIWPTGSWCSISAPRSPKGHRTPSKRTPR